MERAEPIDTGRPFVIGLHVTAARAGQPLTDHSEITHAVHQLLDLHERVLGTP